MTSGPRLSAFPRCEHRRWPMGRFLAVVPLAEIKTVQLLRNQRTQYAKAILGLRTCERRGSYFFRSLRQGHSTAN
jgi:hypothetical protein